jgi:hypothetical protein
VIAMKRLAVPAILAALVASILFFVSARRVPAPVAPALPGAPALPAAAARDCPECRRLAEQIDALRGGLTEVQAQLASQSGQSAPRPPGAAAPESKSPIDEQDVQAVRAADAERRREYMTGIEEGFAGERVDGKWAGPASVRINAALSSDENLRGVAHHVECRQQTCRVELADDGTGAVSRRVPLIALNLVDMLPSVAAERVDQGDGRSAMVVYLSSRQPAATGGK